MANAPLLFWPGINGTADTILDNLRLRVEKRYRRSVVIVQRAMPPNAFAYSFVEDNGTPVIELASIWRPAGEVRATLIHELLHLERRGRKLPVCYLERENETVLPQIMDGQLRELGLQITTLLEHSVIYEQMRDFGLTPESETVDTLGLLLNGATTVSGANLPLPINAAIMQLQTMIELPQTSYPDQVSARLTSLGFGQSAQRARSAYALVQAERPTAPFKQAFLSYRIIETLLDVDAALSFVSEKRGNIRYCAAVVRVGKAAVKRHHPFMLRLECACTFRSARAVF
jgi:hypothetical protein